MSDLYDYFVDQDCDYQPPSIAWLVPETKKCPTCKQPIPVSFLPGMRCSLCLRFPNRRQEVQP